MIYIHVPFCKSFCTYCAFYSEKATAGAVDAYTADLLAEIERRKSETVQSSGPDTLYFGGGTPSLMPLDFFQKVLKALGRNKFEEFTVEVNPEDIVSKGPEYLRGLKALGANRISMGVQSLSDDILKWMNRRHNAATAVEAFELLRQAGFDNISLDLIFGVSGMGDEILLESVGKICVLRPEHISAYQLSIDEGSELCRLRSEGKYTDASEEDCSRQYDLLCRKLGAEGYRHYEISNWCLPGKEAKHNSGYWARVPYAGFGPGAHSFNGKTRSWNSENLRSWARGEEVLGEAEELEERIMLGLRTADGIPAEWCRQETVAKLLGQGLLLKLPDGKIRIQENRFFVSDDIISSLL